MKILLVLFAVALGAAYFYPARTEQTDTACAALDKRVAVLLRPQIEARIAALPKTNDPRAQAAIAGLRENPPVAALVDAMIKQYVPFLPPELGCVAGYWITVAKPDLGALARLPEGLAIKPN